MAKQSKSFPNPRARSQRVNLDPAPVADRDLLRRPSFLLLAAHRNERVSLFVEPSACVLEQLQDSLAGGEIEARHLPPVPQLPIRPTPEGPIRVCQRDTPTSAARAPPF